MSKAKLLIYSDAGQSTGFEKITRNLVAHLSNNYDITVAGLGFFGQVTYPDVKVIPASLNPTRDFLGLTFLERILKQEVPDVILIVQDVWNAMPLAMSIKQISRIPIVLYTMPDSPNIKWIYGLSLTLFDAVLCPTEFGIRELCASLQSGIKKISLEPNKKYDAMILNDGTVNSLTVRVDRLLKYQNELMFDLVRVGQTPIPKGFVNYPRYYFGIPTDRNVILNVNTNSFRKRLDLTLVAFMHHLVEHPHDILVLHCQGGQESGWDIKQLTHLMEIDQSVIYSTKILSEDELFGLYSCADLMINTSSGEGWGMPAMEGHSVGITQLVPDYSATRELWSETARIRTYPHGFHYSNVNTLHGRIDLGDLVYRMGNPFPTALIVPTFTWEQTAKKFDEILYFVLNNQLEPVEYSLNDLAQARLPVRSLAVDLMGDL